MFEVNMEGGEFPSAKELLEGIPDNFIDYDCQHRLTISNCYSSSVTGIQELLGVSCYMDKEVCHIHHTSFCLSSYI